MNFNSEYIIRLALSFVCSFILGLERKSHQHTVGIRTLVSMGISCCLLSILSIYMAESPAVKGDPTRIAAGVITGIGFLGGGAILKLGLNIRGLTTAAIIFTTSAIGMAFGAGLYIPTLIIFFIVIITLFTMDKLEKKFFPAAKTKVVILQLLISNSKTDFQESFLNIMKKHGFIVHDTNSQFLPKENQLQISYTVKTPDKLDTVKIAQEFSEVSKDLLSFSIMDK
ncbi:MAG: MgtC/SapB family protein [Treponema sp.]|nr:MgtC/SapB family protein [Treponema sp.]